MSKRFEVVQDPRVQTEYFIYDNENKISRNITDYPFINQDVCTKIVNLLNEQEQKFQRWKNLYEIKDAEVTARVDALNKVCEYYTSEVLFKSDTDPNRAVKEVLNEILNTEVKK